MRIINANSQRGFMVVIIAGLILANLITTVSAETWVHVNFGPVNTGLEGPSGGSGESWNQAGSATSAASLLDSAGGATTIGWSLTGGALNSSTWGNSSLTMLQGALWTGDSNVRTLTLSGLNAGSKYALYIASYNQDSWGATTMSFSTPNATTTSSPQLASPTTEGASFVLNNNYVVFEEVVPDGSGNIIVTGAKTAGSYGFWSGFQLKETPGPPAGTIVVIK